MAGGQSPYVVDAGALEVIIAGNSTTRDWAGIVDLRGNTDGMTDAAEIALPGSTYLCWDDGKLYIMDDFSTWQEV